MGTLTTSEKVLSLRYAKGSMRFTAFGLSATNAQLLELGKTLNGFQSDVAEKIVVVTTSTLL